MPRRFAITGRILAALMVSLLLVLLAARILLPRFDDIAYALLTHSARERLLLLAAGIADDIGPLTRPGWNIPLGQLDRQEDMDFSLFDGAGARLAGTAQTLPESVQRELTRTGGLVSAELGTDIRSPLVLLGQPGQLRRARAQLLTLIFVIDSNSNSADRYWIGIRTLMPRSDGQVQPATVLASTSSQWRALAFTAAGQYIYFAAAMLLGAAAVWVPTLASIHALLEDVNRAAQEICAQPLHGHARHPLAGIMAAIHVASARIKELEESCCGAPGAAAAAAVPAPVRAGSRRAARAEPARH